MTAVNYYSIEIKNKCGEGAKLMTMLKDAGVDMSGLWGYPLKGKKARFDVIPKDAKALEKAAKKAGIELGKKRPAILLDGEDQAGVLVEPLAKLAAAGVSVIAVAAVCAGAGRFGALLQIDSDDAKKAKKALGIK